MRPNLPRLLLISSLALISRPLTCSEVRDRVYQISIGSLTATVSEKGIRYVTFRENNREYPLKSFTQLAGCKEGKTEIRTVAGGGIEITRTLSLTGNNNKCVLTERFSPGLNSIRWEIEIRGTGDAWTTAITSGIRWPVSGNSRFWAPWSDPRIGRNETSPKGLPVRDQYSVPTLESSWADPLIPHRFVDDTLWYGAPYFRYDQPGIAFIPFQGDLLCIPMATILDEKEDAGISLILNPGDDILDMVFNVSAEGDVSFSRMFNRICYANPLHFSMDLVAHEAGWQGGLRWMSRRYPEYFNPANPKAHLMAGTGAYSDQNVDFDVAKMKKMAFSVNWRASFDFPYMGMFIPPVGEQEQWNRFGGKLTSIPEMRNYATKMKMSGFHVLSYFNVTEFGSRMTYPPPARKSKDDKDLWKDPNDFLYYGLKGALLPVPDQVKPETLGFYSKTKPGGAYYTWEDGLVTDCGEPVYQEFLLDQARRHIELIPDADGICIDRLDWLRMYNENRDDDITWFIDRPARSLTSSWKELMSKLDPLMHQNDKVIFVNNHDKRIDLLKNTDGIFDEFTYAGAPLNTTALLCISKPALGWTADSSNIRKEGADAFFQKYLYMGVFPMAPFPGNDHSIRPDDWTDRQYLDYGPLMSAMKGKKWVLEPHALEIVDGTAKANLFEVPGGYVIPVVFGETGSTANIRIKNVDRLDRVRCDALYPGLESPFLLESGLKNGILSVKVPLIRGCAMVRITRLPLDPPKPYGPLPSAAQLKWHETELFGLVHFSTTTYTNLEWGYGNEPASSFNPQEFNADQVAAAAKAGGLKGLILVTKHHCGFCLWPSEYNENYSVKNSPWKDGKGDMVREYADACKKYGLKFGVYLSPWDRNHKDYGKPEYITYYLNQLRELLTNYGPIFEVWLDGANGGDGWYGGAKEKRLIDKNSYYPFDKIFAMVHELQPDAVIFSDIGPGARWVGNESGWAKDPCWATFTPKNRDGDQFSPVPGNTKYEEGLSGHRDGKYWIPAEADFPLRRGWFYHPDEKPKSPEKLWETYLQTVGRGTAMNIGLAPDLQGLICEDDIKALEGFGRILSATFKTNLAAKAKITAGNIRNNDPMCAPANLVDGSSDSYWATDDVVTNCGIVFDFPEPVQFNVIRFSEYLPLGQRIDGWAVENWTGSAWKEIAKGESIGSCRIIETDPVWTSKIRFRITRSPVCLALSEFGLYLKPSGSDPDEEAREAILKSMRQSQDYWNAGDLDGFMHNYWKSDSLKFIGKTGITYGWDATLKRYKTSYPDKSKQGTLKFDFIHLDKISDDAWFQVGKYTLIREKDTLSGHFSLLWRKIGGQWRIVADHSS